MNVYYAFTQPILLFIVPLDNFPLAKNAKSLLTEDVRCLTENAWRKWGWAAKQSIFFCLGLLS